MANFFGNFPTNYYYLDNPDNRSGMDVVTNVTKRFNISEHFKTNSSLYSEFWIDDEDTPETVAHKYYGDVEKHWLVLMANNMIDPQFDWALGQRSIIKYINEKYTANANTAAGQTGLEWAQANVYAYYKVETKTDTTSGKETVTKITVDAAAYANVIVTSDTYTLKDGTHLKVDITKDEVSYYTHELETNEAKKKIRLIRKEFIPLINRELKSIVSSTT